MASTAFIPGFILYVAAILVPGYGLGELLGRWKEEDSLVERAGYSFGLGLSADTVVYAVKTLGVGAGEFRLAGMGVSVVYFMIILGVAALGASYYLRRSFAKPPSLTWYDGGNLAIVVVLAIAIAAYFTKFTYFPDYQIDYFVHTLQATGLIAGSLVTVPKMLLYGAGNYQIAAGLLSVGGINLVTAERTMTILVLLSPLLVFAVSGKVFGDRRAAFFSTVIYALSGIIWVPMVFAVGLYANFVGVLLELLLVAAFLDLASGIHSRAVWISSLMVMISAYFSHYTVLTVFGSLLIFSLLLTVLRRPGYKGYLAASLVFLAPGAAGALLFRHTLATILTISYGVGSPVTLSTFLSTALSPIPALAYIAVDVSNDLGFLSMVALLAVALYKGYRSRFFPSLLVACWFVAILVAAPENYLAWRFSFEAAVPLILLSGYGLHALLPATSPRSLVRRDKLREARTGGSARYTALVVGLLFLLPTVVNSPAWSMVENVRTNAGSEAQVQVALLQAMSWMGGHTSPGSGFLSVTDPRFFYASVVVDRNTSYDYLKGASQAIAYANSQGEQYIIVTHFDVRTSVVALAPNPFDPALPWYTYPLQNGLTMVYNNTDVMIFEVSGTG